MSVRTKEKKEGGASSARREKLKGGREFEEGHENVVVGLGASRPRKSREGKRGRRWKGGEKSRYEDAHPACPRTRRDTRTAPRGPAPLPPPFLLPGRSGSPRGRRPGPCRPCGSRRG